MARVTGAITENLDVEQAMAALLHGDVVVADAQRVAFVRVGEHTLLIPGGKLTAQMCDAPYSAVLNEYAVARVLRNHAPLRAVPQSAALTHALAPAAKKLEKSALLDTVVRELRAGRRFVGGATTDGAWSVEWNGATFVKTAPDDEGRVHVTELDEAHVRETLGAFSVCGLDRLRPVAAVDERSPVLVALLDAERG